MMDLAETKMPCLKFKYLKTFMTSLSYKIRVHLFNWLVVLEGKGLWKSKMLPVIFCDGTFPELTLTIVVKTY